MNAKLVLPLTYGNCLHDSCFITDPFLSQPELVDVESPQFPLLYSNTNLPSVFMSSENSHTATFHLPFNFNS